MAYHLHLHFIVAGASLPPDGMTWLPVQRKFLVPVKALSPIFCATFREALRMEPELSSQVPPEAWKNDWIVDCRPVGSGKRALKYVAPHIFRVAISNRRLLKLNACPGKKGTVTFQYRDRETKRLRMKTVATEEFTP